MRIWGLWGLIAVLTVVACNGKDDEETGETGTETGVDGSPPVGVIDDPGPMLLGETALSGTASDADEPAQTLNLSLSSDLDGELLTGRPAGDGTWTWTGDLSAGQHRIELVLSDSDGLSSNVERLVSVNANQPPSCEIVAPTDGSTFPTGTSVDFEGQATDPEGETLEFKWRSDLQGPLFIGENYTYILSDGTHVIQLEVTDPLGETCVTTASIQVGEPEEEEEE